MSAAPVVVECLEGEVARRRIEQTQKSDNRFAVSLRTYRGWLIARRRKRHDGAAGSGEAHGTSLPALETTATP